MKNQLIQAMASIIVADAMEKPMKFHVNTNREETGGSPVLKNLRALFANTSKHELVEHPWCNHDEFVEIISIMDISMQVSFSETFNIVTADAVANYVPVVVSQEIGWLEPTVKCVTNNSHAIATRMLECEMWVRREGNKMVKENLKSLKGYNDRTVDVWHDFIVKIISSK